MSKREGKKILKDAKAAGRQYAEDQVNGSYFRDWIWNQLWEASRMDPSEVLPIENKQDAKTVALNTLQQLTWDTKRGLSGQELLDLAGASGVFSAGSEDWVYDTYGISKDSVMDAFYEGFEAELEKKTVINWLADEILNMEEQLKEQQREFAQESRPQDQLEEEARRKPPEMTGGAAEFAELLKSLAHTKGRALLTRIEHRLGGPAHFYERVYVNFVNLPEEIVARKAGGGAESENNRMTFWVEGFNGSDPHAPPPSGKVTVEMHTSALPREYRLRKKTGPPGAIAHYLADFINKVVQEVPPKYTHTQVGEAYHPSRSWEVIATDGGQTEILSRHKSKSAADRAAAGTHMPGWRIDVVPSGTVPRVAEARPRGRSAQYRPTKNWRLRKVINIVPTGGGNARVEFNDGFAVQVHGGHGRSGLIYAMKPWDTRFEKRSPSSEAIREYQYVALRAILDGRPADFVVDSDGDVRAVLR